MHIAPFKHAKTCYFFAFCLLEEVYLVVKPSVYISNINGYKADGNTKAIGKHNTQYGFIPIYQGAKWTL